MRPELKAKLLSIPDVQLGRNCRRTASSVAACGVRSRGYLSDAVKNLRLLIDFDAPNKGAEEVHMTLDGIKLR